MKEPEQENIITVSHLNKSFVKDGTSFQVLKDIDLSVKKGEFVTIVGHSGCGKSTLLKIICGLVSYQDGSVSRNGHTVSGPDAQCGMVFQDHRLLPWLKIKDNIGFIRNMKKAEQEEHIARHLELVGLKALKMPIPRSCPAVCPSAWRLPEVLPGIHPYCCWMSRSVRWMR
ncbi:MAG: ATP-binding cassette domain-containing protein [Ruminococcus sp.]